MLLKDFWKTIESDFPRGAIEIQDWQRLKELEQSLLFQGVSESPFGSPTYHRFTCLTQKLLDFKLKYKSGTELITRIPLSFLLNADIAQQCILPSYKRFHESYLSFYEEENRRREKSYSWSLFGGMGGRVLSFPPSEFDCLQNTWLSFKLRLNILTPSLILQLNEQESNPELKKESIVFFSSLLLEKNSFSDIKMTLINAISSLPQNSKIGFITVAPPPKDTELTFTIYDIQIEQVLDYLERIDWKGSDSDIRLLEDLALHLSKISSDLALDCNLNQTGVCSKISLKFNFLSQPEDLKSWEQTFNYLIEKELCSSNRAVTLLSFLSWKFEGGTFPCATFVNPWLTLEVTLQLDSPVDARAYLGFKEVTICP